jgi:hypothetical protein
MHVLQVDETFDYFDYLGTQLMDNAMSYDVSTGAVSMVVPIDEPSDISTAFNGNLIYNRGDNNKKKKKTSKFYQ